MPRRSQWQCPHCTFINDGAQGRQLHRRLICSVCGKSTDLSELQTSAECPVCTDEKKLVEVPLCGCEVCSDCLCQQIEVRLMHDSSVSVLTCPVCDKLDDRALTDTACEYFPLLQRLLAGQLKPAVMKKLDERLRDWRLKLTDNFCWCSGCSNGFEVSEHHDRQVRCPHCGKETCRKCGKAWHERHRGVSCQQFGEWRQQTDLSERGLAQFLESRGSSCPKCGFQFELSRGGCLHLTCRQCKAEFCSDCGSLFVRQECCGGNKGLHCHHGSECVETFRDWPLEKVRQAALERGVQLELVGVAGAGGRCSVQEQKETSGGGLEDVECGRPVMEAGLCESHLKEALASAMRGKKKKLREQQQNQQENFFLDVNVQSQFEGEDRANDLYEQHRKYLSSLQQQQREQWEREREKELLEREQHQREHQQREQRERERQLREQQKEQNRQLHENNATNVPSKVASPNFQKNTSERDGSWVCKHCTLVNPAPSQPETRLGICSACAQTTELSWTEQREGEQKQREKQLFDGDFKTNIQAENEKVNESEASLRSLMVEFDLRRISDAKMLFKLMQNSEFNGCDPYDLAEAAKSSNNRCDYVDFVKSYLGCECSCCCGEFPKHKLLPMASCQCELCHECFRDFVTAAMTGGGHVTDLCCPMCQVPNANQIEEFESHFGILLPQIKQIQCFKQSEYKFDENVVELVEQRITEWNLYRDPNFRWCSSCGFGMVLGEIMFRLKFQCPNCEAFTCKECKKPWKDQHEGIDCDQFEKWLMDNDPEYQEKGVGFFLQANGIECPNCRFQYALAKGGSLHFTCRMCRFKFCADCDGEYTIIQGRGLSCKHPRDCLFYLRDFGVDRLQQLLHLHKVEFESEAENPVDKCEVMEQKEVGSGLKDEPCGVDVKPGQANLCEKHYIEYLVSLVNKQKLDPVSVMEEGELRGACLREGIDCSGVGENNVAALRALIAQQKPLVK